MHCEHSFHHLTHCFFYRSYLTQGYEIELARISDDEQEEEVRGKQCELKCCLSKIVQ